MTATYLDESTLVAWLQRFVRYPSPQTDLHEEDPAVKAFIRECAAPLLEGLPGDLHYDEMGNLILEAGPPDSGRSILFLAYAMTHPASNMTDPFAASPIETADGPAIRGRGVAEQKTALAAAMAAVADAVAEGKLEGRLTFALTTAGETGRHDAAASVMARLGTPPRQAVICVGTGGRVAIGNKGRIDFDVLVGGRTAHSSAPWKGVNALAGAWRVLERLESYEPGVEPHPAFGAATLTPTAIESQPRATHTVPDLVKITFDRRLLPGEDPERVYDAIAGGLAVDGPWTLDCRRGPVMYPNEIATDGPFYRMLAEAFAEAGLDMPDPLHCDFALDAGYLARQGTEAVMLGPGDIDQFHSDEESVLVADLVGTANVYRRLIDRALSASA